MDEAQFQKELMKYKVVRKPDHYKLRYKKIEKKQAAPAISAPAPAKVTTVAASGDFYDLLAAGPKCGMTNQDWAKFTATMKQSQGSILEVLNLEDLEAIAALV